MKIIDIETDDGDIGVIKTIIEILNGFIPEANADFIKDYKAYRESFNKKKPPKNLDSVQTDEEKTNIENLKSSNPKPQVQIKSKDTKSKKDAKSKKNEKENNIDDDDLVEPEKESKKSKSSKTEKKSSNKSNKKNTNKDDVDINGDESEIESQTKGKKKPTKKKEKDTNTKGKAKKSKKDDDDYNDEEEKKRDENKGVIKILTADTNQVMLTHIILKGSAFKKFVVHPDIYSVGLNLDELYKYIKNVDKEGIMTIHIDSDDTQNIIFDVRSENSASKESICELRVMNLSSRKDRKIEAELSMGVRINCQAFHKACKDLMQFSQYAEITCDPSQLAITCKGDLSNHKRIFKADGSENSITIKVIKKENETENVPNIIRLVFDLKYINSMYKCSSLCGNGGDMEIYLETDSVMFLKYGIKLMGEMLVGISPSRKKKQADNYDKNYEQYYQDDEEIQLK